MVYWSSGLNCAVRSSSPSCWTDSFKICEMLHSENGTESSTETWIQRTLDVFAHINQGRICSFVKSMLSDFRGLTRKREGMLSPLLSQPGGTFRAHQVPLWCFVLVDQGTSMGSVDIHPGHTAPCPWCLGLLWKYWYSNLWTHERLSPEAGYWTTRGGKARPTCLAGAHTESFEWTEPGQQMPEFGTLNAHRRTVSYTLGLLIQMLAFLSNFVPAFRLFVLLLYHVIIWILTAKALSRTSHSGSFLSPWITAQVA